MKNTLARTCLLTFCLVAGAFGAQAQSRWVVEALDGKAFPAEILRETRAKAPDGLPDGLVDVAPSGDIRKAWYTEPTTRYGHAILGDGIEAGTLVVQTGKGRKFRLTLPRSEVFEDRYPRIADLDGDGTNEVVTIRASTSKGASVTVYGMNGETLVEKATTGFIGRANRWLNIAAITPMTGNSGNEIAFVSTPHIGGTLHVVRYVRGKLVSLGSVRGFSNHVIGSREMRLSAVADVDANGRMDIAVPSADRKSLRIMGIGANGLTQLGSTNLPAPIDKAIALQTRGRNGFVVGLEDGSVHLVTK